MTEQKIDPLEAEARAEAEKRWPISANDRIGNPTYSARMHDLHIGFIAGAEWTASRPTGETHDEEPAPADEREALTDAIENARLPMGGTLLGSRVQFAAVADTILAAGFHRHPQPTERETVTLALIDSLSYVDESTDPLVLAARVTAALRGDPNWESVEYDQEDRPQPTEGEPPDALARYQEALDRGLSEREAQEDGWPEGEPSDAQCVRIANMAQEITGRSIWPSTVKAILRVVADQEGENR